MNQTFISQDSILNVAVDKFYKKGNSYDLNLFNQNYLNDFAYCKQIFLDVITFNANEIHAKIIKSEFCRFAVSIL